MNLEGRGPNWERDSSQLETIFERPGESLSDPLLANGSAYVASSSGLHAVEQADGTVRWSLDGDDAVYPFGIANGQLFVGRGSETVSALDLATGCRYWTVDLGDKIIAPIVGHDRLYFATLKPGTVGAVSLTRQAEAWRTTTQHSYVEEMGLGGDHLIVVNEAMVLALDLTSGDELWRRTDLPGRPTDRPIVVDDTVYVTTREGQLLAMALDDGSDRWQTDDTFLVHSPPAVTTDTVYLIESEGVRALSTTDGRTERWRLKCNTDGVVTSPTLAATGLYVSLNSEILVIEPENGSKVERLVGGSEIRSPRISKSGAYHVTGDETGDELVRYWP